MRRLVVLCALALTACATPTLQTRANPRPYPSAAVPATIAGYLARIEPRGEQAFDRIGSDTGVQHGQVWTLIRQGVVVAAVQVAQLKGGLSTRKEIVRAGVRGSVGDGHFRWFKVAGKQWVGVQNDTGVRRYLWLPKRDDLYVIVQVKNDVPDPLSIVEALVKAQEDLA